MCVFLRCAAFCALLSPLIGLPSPLRAADLSLPVTGNLLGSVVNPEGAPQMGATIQLVNKYERVIAKTVSSADGRFAFASIPNDVYSVRASFPSFFPALKNKILIEGGLDSVLQIHFATLFSNIEVSYVVPNAGMTDDWKWVLRSSPATRPINRYANVQLGTEDDLPAPVFSQTHTMFGVSGGAGGFVDSGSAMGDLGTTFALSTSIYGNNQLQLSGSFGESPSAGQPQMAFLAAYSRRGDAGIAKPPEVTLTVSQIDGVGVPGVAGNLTAGNGTGGVAPLRAMSLSVYNTADPLDGVHLEYGATGESVDYLQHTSRVSPFARLTVSAGMAGEIVAAYSDGGRPDILSRHDGESEERANDLSSAFDGIGRLPEISNRNGRLRLERTQNAEVGIRKKIDSTTLAASAFHEDTLDGRINVAGNVAPLAPGDLLGDALSTTSYLNVRNYRREGYLVSSSQSFGEIFELALAYGRIGGFSALNNGPATASRSLALDMSPRNLAAVNLKAVLPVVGTRITADYGWVESGSVIPRHIFTTQNTYVAPGLNIYFRQPLPPIFGGAGRLELTGNLQNMLAQGYLPIEGRNGSQLLIVQAPRSIRGGLNFIF